MATYAYSEGGGTFENPHFLGGTVRDKYGRNLLTDENRIGKMLNADQELERKRLAAREASFNASRNSGTEESTASQSAYSVATAQSLIAKWKRGESLTSQERAIVRKYLSTQGYYGGEEEEYDPLEEKQAEEFANKAGLTFVKTSIADAKAQTEKKNATGFDQLMAAYVSGENQKTSQKSGGNGQGWTTTFSNVTDVGGNNKKMTDSSSWSRSGTASSTSYGPSRSYGYVNKGKSGSSGSGSTMKITYGKANYN